MRKSQAWRILIVEDDPIIAIMMEDMLHELGCAVVGPTGIVDTALKLIASVPIDGAVLDWNLGETNSWPVAEELLCRGTPFVFSTGYVTAGVAAPFDGIPILAKPYDVKALTQALIPLLRRG